jgi:hydrogenase small subunit
MLRALPPFPGTWTPHAGRTHEGVSRRDFVRVCTMAAAAIGLSNSAAAQIAEAAVRGLKPSVIWLHFQECTGCTESLLRTSAPGVAEVILDLLSLDYHETLFAAAGHQAEAALKTAKQQNKGKYILVVEGAIPTKDGGIYCMIGGRTAIDILNDVAADAGAIIALGSCAAWGGVASADPNPTGATGAPMILPGKTIVTLPGCPTNPYNFLGVALQYATFGTLPKLDALGRPVFAYGRTIHEHCPRRAHFDAGRFAEQFGDAGHRQGYCLYKLGCKGPETHANCSVLHYCEVVDAWPIGNGSPCFGCTEQAVGFRVPAFQTATILRATPPATYPPIKSEQGTISPIATGVAGAVGGALIGAGYVASRKLRTLGPAPLEPDTPDGSDGKD